MTAIEYRRYELYCDSPLHDRDNSTRVFRPPAQKARVIARARVRTLARREGWTHAPSAMGHKYDRDFCPEHKPEPTP